MKKYRKILVAYDGSDSARIALTHSIELAKFNKSWIKLLAVVPGFEGDVELSAIDDIKTVIRGPVEEMLSEAAGKVESSGVPVLFNVEQGSAFSEIVEVARDESCDLIVIGRKGHHRIEKMLMGSVTAMVLATSPLDVIVVPDNEIHGMHTALYVIDESSSSDSMRMVMNNAKEGGDDLHGISIVNIYPEFYAEAPVFVEKLEKKAVQQIENFKDMARECKIEVVTHLRKGEPHDEIANCAREINAGIIVINRSNKNSLIKMVSGDITSKVVGYAPCPVLVLSVN